MGTRGKRETELAYTAGLFDGEGYISILRATVRRKAGPIKWHILVAGMSMTDRPTIERTATVYGGQPILYPYNDRFPTHKPIFMWRISNSAALGFIETVYPYLRIKRPQADIARAFQATKSKRWGVRGMPLEQLARRDELCEQMRALNASRFPRPQRLSERAPAIAG